MAADDGTRWDARYADRDAHITPVAPDAVATAGLVDRIPTTGRALDVACGLGAQTIWLAQRGFEVTALDVSHEAVRRVDDAARRHEVHERVAATAFDLDRGLPDDAVGFDIIVCQRFRAPHLYEALIERLVPGGWLIMTVLSETGAADPGEFHAPPGELTLFFDRPGCTLVTHHEADGEESIIVQRSS